MSIVFSAAIGHAPGWTAWNERATHEQRDALAASMATLSKELAEARVDALIMLTSEHWANFFLDHISAFCVGRGDVFEGPIEGWLKIDRTDIAGDPELATQIIDAAYAQDFEPSFGHELKLDHGTMVPLSLLAPKLDVPIVPVFFNTLAAPQPSPRRCFELGRVIGDVARKSDKRIGIVATGGMSHDPGERSHGEINSDFDKAFLDQMARGDTRELSGYSVTQLAAAGAGAIELLAWIALAGALGNFKGDVLAYEAVHAWATGMGVMRLTETAA